MIFKHQHNGLTVGQWANLETAVSQTVAAIFSRYWAKDRDRLFRHVIVGSDGFLAVRFSRYNAKEIRVTYHAPYKNLNLPTSFRG